MLFVWTFYILSICVLPILSVNLPAYTELGMLINLFIKKEPPPGAPPAEPYTLLHGEEVTPHDYPFQIVILSYIQRGSIPSAGVCCGSLISQTAVLSAAHCSLDVVKSIALLGAHNLDYIYERSRLICPVKKWIPHEAYNSINQTNDIAVVKLVDLHVAFDWHKYHGFVKLPEEEMELEGKEGLTLGWGDWEEKKRAGPLRSGKVMLETRETCPAGTDTQLIVCGYGEGGTRPCYKDLGGPLVVDGFLVGVASYSDQNCTEGNPVVYTRVDKYLDWISKNGSPSGAAFYPALYLGLMIYFLV